MSKDKPIIRFALLKDLVLLLCLFAPSAWMIMNIPPLWRDVDAYNQTTLPPIVATYWGHAPAYCYLAKIPLALGDKIERRSMGISATAADSAETQNTPLTDLGVWLLIIGQHLALCGAAFWFIVSIATNFGVRLGLALLWAGNSLFYTFAHCVGSETLSLILVIILVTQGLKLIRGEGQQRWTDWYFFTITLFLCLLSRHINLWLVLLLPATFVASAFVSPAAKSLHLRSAILALMVGLTVLLATSFFTQNIARKTRFRPHSRMGFTFLWRLHFLKDLTPETRAELFKQAFARTDSNDVHKLITLLEQMYQENGTVDAGPYMRRAIPMFFPLESGVQWKKLDGLLNQMARAFLVPPSPELVQAVKADFFSSLVAPMTAVSNHLFASTAYYFDHKNEMPGCADLLTFRNSTAEEISLMRSRHLYLRLWHGLNYWAALLLWFVCLCVLLLLGRRKSVNVRPVAMFAIALLGVGLVMVASTCVLVEYIPRYGMPMWQLLVLSLSILAGNATELLLLRQQPRMGFALGKAGVEDTPVP